MILILKLFIKEEILLFFITNLRAQARLWLSKLGVDTSKGKA